MLTCIFGLTACDDSQALRASDEANLKKAEMISENMLMPYLCTFSDDEMADYYLDEYNKDEMKYVAESMCYTFLTTYGSELQNEGVSYVYIDGTAFMSAITSFNSAFDTIGELESLGEISSELKDDEIIVTIEVTGSKAGAEAEFIFANDIFLTMEAGALNPTATMGDMMVKAALNTLMGMGTVFVVLILISLIISAMGVIPKIQDKMKKKKSAGTSNDGKAESVDNTIAQIIEKEELSDDLELVAVISAAIAAYEGSAAADGFVVKSVRRIRR